MKAIYKMQIVAVLLVLATGFGLPVMAGHDKAEPGAADSSATKIIIQAEDSRTLPGLFPPPFSGGDFSAWYDSWYEIMEFGGIMMPGDLDIPDMSSENLDYYRSGEFLKVSETFQTVLQLLLTLPKEEQVIEVYPRGRKVRFITMQEHEPILELDENEDCLVMPIYLMCCYDLTIEEFGAVMSAVMVNPGKNTARYLYDFEKQLYVGTDGRILPVTPCQLLKIAMAFSDIDLKELYIRVISDSLDYEFSKNAKD